MNARVEKERQMLLITNRYLDAMCKKKPESLPLAPNVRATYDGEERPVGQNEMWEYAIRIPSRQTFTDVDTNNVCFFGTATNTAYSSRPESMPAEKFYWSRWYFFFLRLKFTEDLKICEIEEVVINQTQGSYNPLEGAAFSQLIYEIPVQEKYRLTREEMIKIVDDYWSAIPKEFPGDQVLCHPDSSRIENGTPSTDSVKFPYSLSAEFDVGKFNWKLPREERRFPIVDVELGIVVSIVVMHGYEVGNRNTIVIDAFKIDRGLIRKVDCLSKTVNGVSHTGWANWPDNCCIY